MSIYTRMAGTEEAKIGVHTFFAVLQEWMLGEMTGAAATAALGLSSAEQTEATEIRDRILAITNANAALQRALRTGKAAEMENVLILAESRIAGYTDMAVVRARVLE